MLNTVLRRTTMTGLASLLIAGLVIAGLAGCGDDPADQTGDTNQAENHSYENTGENDPPEQSENESQNEGEEDYINAGELDSSFGDEGTVTVNTGVNNYATELLIRDDDSVILVGWSDYKDGREIVLIALTAEGVVDNSFGESGIVRASIGDDTETVPHDATIDDDGTILVAAMAAEGGLYSGEARYPVLTRFERDGSLDDSFGQEGLVTEPELHDEFAIQAVTVQRPDGRIIVGGRHSDADSSSFALRGYDETGAFDETFGDEGTVRLPLSPNNHGIIRRLETQSDGSIVAAGNITPEEEGEEFVALMRYRPDGALDTSFGDDGVTKTSVETGMGSTTPVVTGLAIDENDQLAACGHLPFFAARYDADGLPITDFGQEATATENPGEGSSRGRDCIFTSDGHLIQTGSAQTGGTLPDSPTHTYNFATIRYEPDGAIDETFGDDGLATNEFHRGNFDYGRGGVVEQSDGGLVVGGVTDRIVDDFTETEYDFAFARYK